jgi:segregation and condensation protein B
MVEAALDLVQNEQLPYFPRVEENELQALIEALLLVAPDPVEPRDLAQAAGVSLAEIEDAIDAMNRAERGWTILRHHGTVQLASAPRFAERVRSFLKLNRESRLSGAALETLTLIAYRQPVTRAEIDALRGVDSSGVLAKLHARGLIEIVGRLSTVGNPHQYGTTIEFLRHFGLKSLDDLPPLEEISGNAADQLFAEIEGSAEQPASVATIAGEILTDD